MGSVTGYHISVTGRVQGVGYRYYCSDAARSMGLRGYVMNMPDGSVELEVFGEKEKLGGFITEISRRDRGFSVQDMKYAEIPDDKRYGSFTIRF